MAEYDEFRIQLSPVVDQPDQWSVQLLDCSIAQLIRPYAPIKPTFQRSRLLRLRNRTGWPDISELTGAGQDVWDSLLKPLEAAYRACFALAQQRTRGLRIVVTLTGQEMDQPLPNGVRISELPIEALCDEAANFVAPRPLTPVSRSFHMKPDRKPAKITLPLRILVVIAAPKELPPASMGDEKKAIEDALRPLSGPGGTVHLEVCAPGTKDQLRRYLEDQSFNVVHFIAHGNFDVAGNDPTPRAFICLDDGSGDVDPLDARMLDMLVKDTEVRLIVITACSSAAPAGDQYPYRLSAFEGMAQKLLAPGGSEVTAVVAMQFDFESDAAPVFSRVFYENLLKPNMPLDEAVAKARRAVAVEMEPGHRAWVTPTLYIRTEECRVFEFNEIRTRTEFSDDVRRKIIEIDSQLEVYRRAISEMLRQPDTIRSSLRPLRDQYQEKLNQLGAERGMLLGDSIRLIGGQAQPGDTVSCQLKLRLRSPAVIDTIDLTLLYPKKGLTFLEAKPAAGGSIPASAFSPSVGDNDARRILITDVSDGAIWPEGEHDLAVLDFEVEDGAPEAALVIRLGDKPKVTSTPETFFATLDAVVFVLDEDEGEVEPIRGEPLPRIVQIATDAAERPAPAPRLRGQF